jgi:hypothetical protein
MTINLINCGLIVGLKDPIGVKKGKVWREEKEYHVLLPCDSVHGALSYDEYVDEEGKIFPAQVSDPATAKHNEERFGEFIGLSR